MRPCIGLRIWRSPPAVIGTLDFYLDERHLLRVGIDHVVLDPGVSAIGRARRNGELMAISAWLYQLHLAVGQSHDHIVEFMDVPAGLLSRFEIETGNTSKCILNKRYGLTFSFY